MQKFKVGNQDGVPAVVPEEAGRQEVATILVTCISTLSLQFSLGKVLQQLKPYLDAVCLYTCHCSPTGGGPCYQVSGAKAFVQLNL